MLCCICFIIISSWATPSQLRTQRQQRHCLLSQKPSCIEVCLNIKGGLLTTEQHCLRPVCFYVWHHSQQANNNYRQFLHFIDKLSSLKTPTSHFLLSRLTAVFQILNLNYVQVCFFNIIFCFFVISVTFKTKVRSLPTRQGQETGWC